MLLERHQERTSKISSASLRFILLVSSQWPIPLDAAVIDAYGWPHDITDEQILENLVALNAERAEEERNGLIRWLRPEYQAPTP